MARDRYDYDDEEVEQVQKAPKKADVILKRQQEMAEKQQEAMAQTAETNVRLDRIMEALSINRDDSATLADRNKEFYDSLGEETASLRRDLKFMAAQNEGVFNTLADKLDELAKQIESLKAAQPAQQEAAAAAEPVEQADNELDYDLLADKVAQRIPAPQVVTTDEAGQTVVQQAEIDYDLLAEKVAARIPAQEEREPVQVTAEVDYELLAEKVARRVQVPAGQTIVAAAPVEGVRAEIDYDLLADKVAQRIPAPQAVETAQTEIDLDDLAERVAQRIQLPAAQTIVAAAPAEAVQAEIDADALADKILARMPLQEAVSPDYVASKVAEQIIIPAARTAEIDYEALAEKVAERIPAPQTVTEGEAVQTIIRETADIDYDLIASKVAEQIVLPEVAATAAVSEVNEEELAEIIASKIDTQKLDILVDDEGCSTISKGITENLNYDLIAEKVAELLGSTLNTTEEAEAVDYDEMARRISENITVAGVNEDAIAEKAAQVLSNYLPEFDTDEIADKVATQVISALPAAEAVEIDSDAISSAVVEKIIAQQAEHDYDIVVDEDGLDKIAETVAERLANAGEEAPDYEEMAHRISENITVAGVDEDAIAQKAAAVLSGYVFNTDEIADKVAEKVLEAFPEEEEIEVDDEEYEDEEYNLVIDEDGINEVTERVTKGTEERFNTIDREIAEIKQMLAAGVCVVRETEIAGAEACEEVYEEEPEEEALVTVSDVIAEETVEEEVVEEQPEESEDLPTEEVTEEVVEEPVEEEVAQEAVEEAEEEEETEEEELVEEFSYDDLVGAAEGEGGVDFANMMRYNRSFIARIIQGTDEQKTYYGEVRNALLSYKKVNSNIAWGAERFHKGRETIARFKIRGKTLVVYLALDPAAHEYSVYHHKDVSNNKSVAGTPMMIKVKSPLGVKKAVRLIDEMLLARNGEKRNVPQRDYAAMYPYETIEELIEDGLVKDVKKDN